MEKEVAKEMVEVYLAATPLLDFRDQSFDQLEERKGWARENFSNDEEIIGTLYGFVKDEIKFGYNRSDDLKASQVLKDSYGQCNTKGVLFMALLRRFGIPCRFHGFTIENRLQKGAIPWYVFWLAPKRILHSWVEVFYQEKWVELEGFILDKEYLRAVQQKFMFCEPDDFVGYGIATTCLKDPKVEWTGRSTFIQKEGIHDDFGVYDSPDEFYKAHGTNLKGFKRFLYQNFVRHIMNWNVNRIRLGVRQTKRS